MLHELSITRLEVLLLCFATTLLRDRRSMSRRTGPANILPAEVKGKDRTGMEVNSLQLGSVTLFSMKSKIREEGTAAESQPPAPGKWWKVRNRSKLRGQQGHGARSVSKDIQGLHSGNTC